jgi:hypothetical protein
VRNAFLITAMLFSLAAAAMAAEQKNNDAQPQSQQTEPAQMARNHVDGPANYASSTQSDCVPAAKPSQTKPQRTNSEGDPQASQNHVEYGGAG